MIQLDFGKGLDPWGVEGPEIRQQGCPVIFGWSEYGRFRAGHAIMTDRSVWEI